VPEWTCAARESETINGLAIEAKISVEINIRGSAFQVTPKREHRGG
jgi:hypothetical protein